MQMSWRLCGVESKPGKIKKGTVLRCKEKGEESSAFCRGGTARALLMPRFKQVSFSWLKRTEPKEVKERLTRRFVCLEKCLLDVCVLQLH